MTKAQKNLRYYELLTEDISSTLSEVYAAAIRNDYVFIWFSKGLNKPTVIQIYNLNGECLFGYRLLFDWGNGIFNVNVGEDWLQIFTYNFIYQFQSENVEYFYVSPEYHLYLYEYMGDDVEVAVHTKDLHTYMPNFYENTGKRPMKAGEPFLRYTRYTGKNVVLTTSDGKEIVLLYGSGYPTDTGGSLILFPNWLVALKEHLTGAIVLICIIFKMIASFRHSNMLKR